MQLFSKKYLQQFDPEDVLGTVMCIPDQAEQAWREASRARVPASYAKARHIVVCGMGGSLLGAHVIKEVFADRIRAPLTLVNGYQLPASVTHESLVLLSSYSGTTEEILSCAKQALKKTEMVCGISVGGPLSVLLRNAGKPVYQIVETFNPSHQPRMGVGYSVYGQLGLLHRCIGINSREIHASIAHVRKVRDRWVSTASGARTLFSLCKSLQGRMPIMVGPEFLVGSAHIGANQWNENAKTFATYFTIPELNHHLLEGLDHPRSITRSLCFIFLSSSLFLPRNTKRVYITERIIRKQGAGTQTIRITGSTKLAAACESLVLTSLLTTVYALSQKINPSPIPWVDYFKKYLAKK